jgi:hypothetical protein
MNGRGPYFHFSKKLTSNYRSCKRLEIISHEDIDTQADPAIVPFVATAVAQAMRWYDPEKRAGLANLNRSISGVSA